LELVVALLTVEKGCLRVKGKNAIKDVKVRL
jgi:hypothetical protein